jgi:hypothetical protein
MIDNPVQLTSRVMDRPRWGQTTLANAQQPSMLNDPDQAALANGSYADACTFTYGASCYSRRSDEDLLSMTARTARLANLGTRVWRQRRLQPRPYNIGGDGEPVNNFAD